MADKIVYNAGHGYGVNSHVDRSAPFTPIVTSRNLMLATGSGDILGFIKKIDFIQSRTITSRYELGLDEISYLSPGPAGKDDKLTVERFLIFEGSLLEMFGGNYSISALGGNGVSPQGNYGFPVNLLDFDKPFDIYIYRIGPLAGFKNDSNNSRINSKVEISIYNPVKVLDNLSHGDFIFGELNNNLFSPDQNPYELIAYYIFRECWFTSYKWSSDVGADGAMGPVVETADIRYTWFEARGGAQLKSGSSEVTSSSISSLIGELFKQ